MADPYAGIAADPYADLGDEITPVGPADTGLRALAGSGGVLLDALNGLFDPGATVRRALGGPDEIHDLAANASDYARIKPNEIPENGLALSAQDLGGLPGGAVEGAMNLGSMMAALPVAGAAGLGTAAGNALGLTNAEPGDVVNDLASALTYQPKTPTGQSIAESAALPFELLAKGGRKAGEFVQDETGSPIAATAVDTAIQALPMLLGARGARGAPDLPSGITPDMVDAFLRDNPPPMALPPGSLAEAPRAAAPDITDAEFSDLARLMAPDAVAGRLPAPDGSVPREIASPESPPVQQTEPSLADILAAVRGDLPPMARAALDRAENSRPSEDLAEQRADDAPPWWLAGQMAEAEIPDSRIATDLPPPEPAPKPVAPQAESGRAATHPEAIDFEQYASQRGGGFNFGNAGMHSGRAHVSGAANRAAMKTQNARDAALMERRSNLRAEYDAAVERGEIRPLDRMERLKKTAAGHPDNPSVQAARRILDKQGIPYGEESNPGMPAPGVDDTPEPPLDIRYGKRRLPARIAPDRDTGAPPEPPARDGALASEPEVRELGSEDLSPDERAAFERQSSPRELSETDLTPAERESFARQRAEPAERGAERELSGQMAEQSRTDGAADADRNGLRAAVDEVLAGAEGAPKVEFVRDEDGLPEGTRLQSHGGKNVRREGLYDPNTKQVHILTNEVTTPERAAWVAAHEIAGHHGLRGLMGERALADGRKARDVLDAALDTARQNPTVAKLADAIGAQRKSSNPRLMAEEAIAELAAAARTGNWDHLRDRYGVDAPEGVRSGAKTAVRRFVERIKALLAKLFKKARFSDIDVHQLVEDAWQYVRRPRAESMRETMRGAEKPRESDRGDVTETPAFKRWFGDSKVVDESGKPLVMYHARRAGNDFSTFRGDRPIFFAYSKRGASRAASPSTPHDYVEAYIRAVRPANTPETPVHFLDAGKAFNKNRDADAVYVEDEAGVSLAVRSPSQIKSATGNRGTFDPNSDSILESAADPRDESLESVAADSTDIPRPERETEAPSRRPGESQRDYARRVMRTGKEAIAEATKLAKHQQKVGRANFRAMLAKQARALDVADATFAEARKLFDKTPEKINLATIDQWENGASIGDRDAAQFFSEMKSAFDQRIERIRELDPSALQSLIENYFPHIWEDSAKAAKWYQGFMARRPLEGNKSFMKQRTWGTIKEGMASGLKPVSTNPVDLALLKLSQMDKFIAFHEFRDDLKARGWLKEMEAGARAPEGYARIDDPAFAKAGGLAGYYAVPELIAKDVNNYLAPSLYRFGAWKSLRAVQNTLMSARLGMSLFHAGFTSLDNLVQHVGVGLQRFADGDVAGGLKMILRDAPASFVAAPLEGGRLIDEWRGKSESDPHTAALLNLIEQGGGRWKMSTTDYNQSIPKVLRAVRQRQMKGETVGHALSALGEASGWLIHYWLVPRQKMAARVMLLKFELDHFAKALGKERGDYAGIVDAMHPDVAKQLAGKAVDAVDNRLGQMTYDNQFWNKTVREVAQAVVGAVGWQVGTVRTVTSGLRDVYKAIKPEELVATLDKAGKITDQKISRVGGNLLNLISLAIIVGGGGAILQKLLTGIDPEGRDYFFPRTGRRNPDDSEERFQLPTYWMDHYKLATHPLTTLSHKLHPSISMLMDLFKNQDYFGTQIRNPDDSLMEQAKDIAGYVAKGFVPYSLNNQSQLAETDSGAGDRIGNFFGVTHAPASVSRSEFQTFVSEKAYDAAPKGSRTQEAKERSDTMHGVEAKLRALIDGTPDWEKIDGDERFSMARKIPEFAALSSDDQRKAIKAANMRAPEIRFLRLGIGDKLRAWDMATPEERERYNLRAIILRSNLARSSNFQRMPEDEKRAIRDRIQRIAGQEAVIGTDDD